MRELTHEDEICRAFATVGDKALQEIDRTYGNPRFGQVSLTCAWPYHNGFHGRYVGRTGEWVCEALGGDTVEQAVTRNAGHAHDVRQGAGHERLGADWLERTLQQQGIPPHLRRMGALAILGTLPQFDGNFNITGQAAATQRYKTAAEERVAHSVATGDLAMIHDPMGPYWARMLFVEINKGQFDLDKMIAFQERQITLASGEFYHYPVTDPGVLRQLEQHKLAVVKHHERVLERLQAGSLTTLEQIVAYDLAFARSRSTK